MKQALLILILYIIWNTTSFSQNNSIVEAYITELKPSLISEDHTAEGMLETLDDGSVIHIFRLDPGHLGHHIGNNSRIVKRYSYDNGASWTEPETIYESEYDDRNVHGGLVGNNRLVVFFRRYNAIEDTTADMNFIYSDDYGYSWTEPNKFKTIALTSGTHKIIKVPTKGYMNSICRNYYLETRFSREGSNWDSIAYKWDYLETLEKPIGEGSFAYLKDGNIVGLFRNTFGSEGANYTHVVSHDYGDTWTEPELTNMADSFYCPSPLIFYNEEWDDVWSIASDRRALINPNYDNNDSEFWIYRNTASEIIDNPKGFNLFHKLKRPMPSYYRLYGYPCVTKLQDGNYLVIVTDSRKKSNGLEDADFYQFEIKYSIISSNENNEIDKAVLLSQNYPNPANNYTSIDFYRKGSESGSITFYDMHGTEKLSINIEDFDSGMNSVYFDISDFNAGVYFYTYRTQEEEITKKMVVIK